MLATQGCEELGRMMPKLFRNCPVLKNVEKMMMKLMTLIMKMTTMAIIVLYMRR